MKKFYTLLSAALLATGLLSAASLKTAELKNVEIAVEAQESVSPVKKVRLTKVSGKSAQSRIKDPNETAFDPTGTYVSARLDEKTYAYETVVGILEITAKGEGYVMTGLMGEDVEIPVKLGKENVTGQDGKPVSVNVLKIPAAGSTTLFTEEGVDYKIWLVGYNAQGQFVRYTNETIDLEIDEYGLWWVYDADFGAITDTGMGYNLGKFNAPIANASMTAVEKDENTGESYDMSVKMACVYPSETQISLLAFAGFPGIVTFNLDGVNLTATNARIGSASTTTTQYDVFASNTKGGKNLSGTLSLGEDNETLIMTIPGTWYATVSDLEQALYSYTNTVIILNDDDANAGVEEIVADSDVNAPVEYFNLQGVRVANPEAGQLVIKRQGKTVSKVIVR